MTTEVKNPFTELHYNVMRRYATANGMKTYGKTREELEVELFERFPNFIPEDEAPPPTAYLKVEQHTRDATQILDQDGNKLCMVYRVGREIDGKRALLPMEENARKIVDALKRLD